MRHRENHQNGKKNSISISTLNVIKYPTQKADIKMSKTTRPNSVTESVLFFVF